MKKFEFKLEALLKLRKLKEDECKNQIGIIQNKILEAKNNIHSLDLTYQKYQEEMNEKIKEGINSLYVSNFSLVQDNYAYKRRVLEEKIESLNDELKEKLLEYNAKRAELKVVEKLKEKDLEKFKKERNKKLNEEIEENYLIQLLSKKEIQL